MIICTAVSSVAHIRRSRQRFVSGAPCIMKLSGRNHATASMDKKIIIAEILAYTSGSE